MATTAVLMVGGPTKGTRFRPLSLTVAKPLFPIAGKPLVMHPVLACKKIPNLLQVVLIGFYSMDEMGVLDTASLSRELGVPVTYLQEGGHGLGSAGGLYHFKDILLQGDPKYLFVLNCDVCSDCPLNEMLDFQMAANGLATMLIKQTGADVAKEHGQVVCDEQTGQVVHYAEKPETLVSNKINCGIYVFSSPEIFSTIESVSKDSQKSKGMLEDIYAEGNSTYRRASSRRTEQLEEPSLKLGMSDVFSWLAENEKMFAYESNGFWEVLKTPGMSLRFSALYLSQMGSDLALARSKLAGGPEIKGSVYIHPDAEVHPTAKLGPNVAIEAGASIGPGVRLVDCIILDDVHVMANACVVNAIVGWSSKVGPWARIQGTGDYDSKLGVTILSENVQVGPEVVVVSSTILPHKEIKNGVRNEILL